MFKACLVCLAGLALAPAAHAAGAAAKASVPATAIPSAAAIRVDGDLSDEVWKTAPVISGFKQREPRDGEPATFQTEVRVAYDATAMYIAVDAFDPEPARLVGIRTRRDEDSPSDWIRVMIDSFHDRRSAFSFAVNPAGVKQDAYWFNDGNYGPGLGRGVGRGGDARRARLARGVPHSVFAAPLPRRGIGAPSASR